MGQSPEIPARVHASYPAEDHGILLRHPPLLAPAAGQRGDPAPRRAKHSGRRDRGYPSSGDVVTFVGLHPKPPQVWQSARGRDAELYAAANVLRERTGPGLLAGDLNATPWELAVERMQRLAGLVDPRRGYGYVATWNAKSSWIALAP